MSIRSFRRFAEIPRHGLEDREGSRWPRAARRQRVVGLVDQDPTFRGLVADIVDGALDARIESFPDTDRVHEGVDFEVDGCLVVGRRFSGSAGLELLDQLERCCCHWPVIVVTDRPDVPWVVRTVRAGAFDFLVEPFAPLDLLRCIEAALERSGQLVERARERWQVEQRRATLTRREQQVLDLVVSGLANKVVASRLGIAERTVELHRSKAMRKMEADSLAELVRMSLVYESRLEDP